MKRNGQVPNSDEPNKKREKLIEDHAEEGTPTGPLKNPPVHFSITDFRLKLKTTEALTCLRDFANCAEWGTSVNDVVLEYLEAGGSISEITSLLDLTAQGDLATALPVFRATFLIILKIQSEAKMHLPAARQDAENLLASFVSTFQAMLTITSAKHRKVVLKLLACLVSLQPSFARQILNWFSLTPPQLENFVEPGPVRKAFIMFLMAFFFEGNASTFRPLLDKKGFLSSILPNLKFDDADTTVLVLNVLTEKMLLNSKVAKTTKLNIFNTQAIQCLFQLYDWVGPKAVTKGWAKRTKKVITDPEALSTVRAALDVFLNVLCTNKKHGIIFWDKGLGVTDQSNQLILTALEVVPKPWKKSEISKLIANILVNCPDIIKTCLTKWEASFEPRESETWTEATDFLIEVLEGLDTETMMCGASEVLSPNQIQNALNDIFINTAITNHLQLALADSQPISIRCQSLNLVRTITSGLNKCLNSNYAWMAPLRKSVITNIKTILPNISSICQLWETPNEDVPSKNKSIARLLMEIAKMDPSLIEDKQNLCNMLMPTIIDSHADLQLSADILGIVCILDSSVLSKNNEWLRTAFETAFNLSCYPEKYSSPLAQMLRNTALFKNVPAQLDVFMLSWKCVANETTTHIAELLVDIIVKTAEGDEKTPHLLDNILEDNSLLMEKWSDSQRKVFMEFFTHLVFHMSCLSDCIIPADIHKVMAFKMIGKCLAGNISGLAKKKIELLNPQLAFLKWLLGDEELLAVTDVLQLFSRLLITTHFIRLWLKNEEFCDTRKAKCKLVFESIMQAADLDRLSTFEMRAAESDFTVAPSPFALFQKVINIFFTDPVFIKAFSIYSGCDSFTCWAKEVVETLRLSEYKVWGWLPSALLLSWKKELIEQLQECINDKNNKTLSNEFSFWLKFLKPTIEELTPTLERLSATKPEIIAGSNSLGVIWKSVLQALPFRSLPRPLLNTSVRCLCAAALISPSDHNCHDALFGLFNNYAMSVLVVPDGFLKETFNLKEPSDSLIRAIELHSKSIPISELVNHLCDSVNELDGRLGVAIIGSLAKRKDCYSIDTLKQGLGKKIHSALPTIAQNSWPYIKQFLRGYDDAILSDWEMVVHLLIIELGSMSGTIKIAKSFKKIVPRCKFLPTLASVLYAEQPELVTSWFYSFIFEPSNKCEWLQKAETLEAILKDDQFIGDFVSVRMSKKWKHFVNDTLRNLSLKSDYSDQKRWKILRLITEKTWCKGANNAELEKIFKKCSAHSEFIPVMLSNEEVKEELVRLLLAVAELWPAVMLLNHVPLYLAAYHASLSICDQLLLQLLRTYENHLGSLSKFEPFFWGQPAVSHYSVRNQGGLSLWKQINMKTVLELLSVDEMLLTVTNFPISRKLKEKVSVTEHDSRRFYDPAFLLPLFSKMFSPGAVSYCLSFVHRGALSFTIAALSSQDVDIRAAAALVLSRFYTHLQLTQFLKQKPVWLHVVDCLRYGLDDLSTSPVPGVVTTFWARAVMEVSDPQAPLYSLHRLLLAKPNANLRMVPEFTSMFFSQDANCLIQRKWILEVVRDGLRHQDDVLILLKSSLVSTVLTYFSSPYSTYEIKCIVLELCAKILFLGIKLKGLFDDLGLDMWLRTTAREIKGGLILPFSGLLLEAKRYQLAWQHIHGRVVKKPAPTFVDAAELRFILNR